MLNSVNIKSLSKIESETTGKWPQTQVLHRHSHYPVATCSLSLPGWQWWWSPNYRTELDKGPACHTRGRMREYEEVWSPLQSPALDSLLELHAEDQHDEKEKSLHLHGMGVSWSLCCVASCKTCWTAKSSACSFRMSVASLNLREQIHVEPTETWWWGGREEENTEQKWGVWVCVDAQHNSLYWTISFIFSQTLNFRLPRWFTTLIRAPETMSGSSHAKSNTFHLVKESSISPFRQPCANCSMTNFTSFLLMSINVSLIL